MIKKILSLIFTSNDGSEVFFQKQNNFDITNDYIRKEYNLLVNPLGIFSKIEEDYNFIVKYRFAIVEGMAYHYYSELMDEEKPTFSVRDKELLKEVFSIHVQQELEHLLQFCTIKQEGDIDPYLIKKKVHTAYQLFSQDVISKEKTKRLLDTCEKLFDKVTSEIENNIADPSLG